MPQGDLTGEHANGQKKLLGGVLLLLPATVFSKLVGLFYKIPLILIVGVEGMAYFLAAYHVYSLLFVLSATGLPTALALQVSRAVAAEKRRAVRRILGISVQIAGKPERSGAGNIADRLPAVEHSTLSAAFLDSFKKSFNGANLRYVSVG